MSENEKLSYNEVEQFFESEYPTKTDAEVRELSQEFYKRHNPEYEAPEAGEEAEIDSGYIDEISNYITENDVDMSLDENDLIDNVAEINDISRIEARRYVSEAKIRTSPDYKYYKRLTSDEQQTLRSLQKHHPDRQWTAEKYYTLMKRK
jgi:hypothetical protein